MYANNIFKNLKHTHLLEILHMSSVFYCKCRVQRLSCLVFVMSIVCYVQCLLCPPFVMSAVCYVPRLLCPPFAMSALCYVCPLICPQFVMYAICYVCHLLCSLFVMSAVCYVCCLLCLLFVMSSISYVRCLSVQGLSCLLFVLLGFDIAPSNNRMNRILVTRHDYMKVPSCFIKYGHLNRVIGIVQKIVYERLRYM